MTVGFNLFSSSCQIDNYDQEKTLSQDYNYSPAAYSQEVWYILRLITNVFLSDDILQQVFLLRKCDIHEDILNAVGLLSSWFSDL